MKPELLAALARADLLSPIVTLRSGGLEVDRARRDEMLAQVKAGAYVELDVEVLAYEQRAGEMNRNYVRFRDGSMMSVGRSGKGKPFLRDHEQHDVTARAGTILESSTEKRADGDYAIRMTVRLTAPWAVELALRGLLSTVSIGWSPTGPVECSVCQASIFTKCYHWPGDRLRESTDPDGNPIKVRDRNGPITVEWIYTSAELVECSAVSVPAVPGAHIEGVRAALAAAHPEFRAYLAPEGDGFAALAKDHDMKTLLAALVASLSLAPTAGEDDVTAAVGALNRERDTLATKLEIAEGERVRLSGIVATHAEAERKHAEDGFIRDALATGRIAVADEPVWRKLYALDQAGAKADMAKRAVGCSTPVGAPRQTPTNDPVDPPAENGSTPEVGAQLASVGVTETKLALDLAKAFGVKNPKKSIPQALGLKTEV